MVAEKKFTYPFDPTGREPKNLIKNELHQITPENRTPQNVIIPGWAPFFRQSLIVIDVDSNYQLAENIDYVIVWPILEVENDKYEAYTPIYGGIQFLDTEVTGRFAISYQTIGGQYALDGVEAAQALANQAGDPKTTTFEEILGKPLKFTPMEHIHDINDFVGFNDLVFSINNLTETIKLNIKEDRYAHPGYETLIDEYFRLEKALENFKAQTGGNLDEFREEFNRTKEDLSNRLEEAKRDLNQRLSESNNNLQRQLNSFKETTNNNLKSFRQDFDIFKSQTNQTIEQNKSDIEARLEEFKKQTNNNLSDFRDDFDTFKRETNTHLSDMGKDFQKQITDNKNNIENTVAQNKAQVLSIIEQNKQDMQHKLDDFNGQFNGFKSGMTSQFNDFKNTTNNSISNLQNQLNSLSNGLNDRFVRTDNTDQWVGGNKNFNQLRINGLGIWKSNQGGRDCITMGDISVNDAYVRSDRRIKHEIKDIENGLDVVTKLKGHTYRLQDNERHTAGVIAQELREVLPDLVSKNDDGLLSVQYNPLIAYLIEAVKELKSKNDVMQEQLNKILK